MLQWISTIELPNWKEWIQVLILTAMIYYVLRQFKGTRGSAILSGLIFLYVVLYAVTSLSHLDVLNWLLAKLMFYIPVVVIVIFQPEIRCVLAQLGR